MYSPSGHQGCRWFGFFFWTDLEKCSITSLVVGSSAVNGCHQNESKQLIKHHNKPHHSSPSVNVLWSKRLHVCKKQIYQDVINFKPLILAKIPVHIHINTSSSEKVYPLLSSHIKVYRHIWTVFTCKRCLICAYFTLDLIFFSLEKAILWIEDSYFRCNSTKLKTS